MKVCFYIKCTLLLCITSDIDWKRKFIALMCVVCQIGKIYKDGREEEHTEEKN